MADSYTGRVCNGVVVFDGGPMPADGTTVRVEPEKTELTPIFPKKQN